MNTNRIVALACAVLMACTSVGRTASAEPLALPGLEAAAEIVRDAEGIAHIRAQNRTDLFYLQGWVHAEDRLFQMDLLRRSIEGRLSEIVPAFIGGEALVRPADLGRRPLGRRGRGERRQSRARHEQALRLCPHRIRSSTRS